MTPDELRAARRERVFDGMKEAGLDVLVLGRRDSIVYATGHRSLWTAGTRPFGAACVLVGAARAVHLLSTWDEGVPDDIPFEHLYGITWNPATMAASLRSIPGVPEARRVGVDALSPGFARAATRLAPQADLVPVDDLLHTIRATKLPAEIDRIRAATTVSRTAVAAATEALGAGASHPEARATIHRTLATHGVTVSPSPPTLEPTPAGLTRIDVSALVDGYEGGAGRTVGGTSDPSVPAFEALAAACRPGATPADLRQAASGTDRWQVHGIGLGLEPPVITPTLGTTAELNQGMVLSIEVEVDGHHRCDLAIVGSDTTDPV